MEPLTPRSARVITCSDSVAAGATHDRSGPIATELLAAAGWSVDHVNMPDDQAQIASGIRAAVAAQKNVVVCTGGTGLGPRDVTPEAVQEICDRWIPGIGEAIRANARAAFPMTDLSRMGAGVVDQTVVVALPGSTGGVRDGLAVVIPLLPHLIDMLAGGGHGSEHTGSSAQNDAFGTATTPPRHSTSTPESDWPTATSPDRTVSGADGEQQARAIGWVTVGPEPIVPESLTAAVRDDRSGAVATFEGRVRNHDGDLAVVGLEYEAHPQAANVLTGVCSQATQLDGVVRVAAAHRTGSLAVADLAFCVAVSAPHRNQAYAALEWLVDTAKAELPVWKKQTFADGTSGWVNCA